MHIKRLQFSMLPLETKQRHNELECEEEKLLSFYTRCYRRSVIPAPVHSSLVQVCTFVRFFFSGIRSGVLSLDYRAFLVGDRTGPHNDISPGSAGKKFFLSEVVNPVVRQA